MSTNRHIVAFVGMPGSGKGSCTDYLHQEKGYPLIYFGGIVVDEVKRRGLEVNEKNEKSVREELRAKGGIGVLGKLVAEKIHKAYADEPLVVLDGLYSWSEYKILRNEFGDAITLVAVYTPKQTRYQRLAKRPVRPLTEAEVSSRDIAEIENLEKGGPIAYADFLLTNTETLDDLHRELDKVVKQIYPSYR